MKLSYVFDAASIDKFKYCPYCGSEILQVYPGDYMGHIQCSECDECDEELNFIILEEMISRFPEWWEKKK